MRAFVRKEAVTYTKLTEVQLKKIREEIAKIETTKQRRIDRRVDVDIIADLVTARLQRYKTKDSLIEEFRRTIPQAPAAHSQGGQNNKVAALSVFATILTIVVSVVIIYTYMGGGKDKFGGQIGVSKGDEDMFKFKNPKDFKDYTYHGKKDVLKKMIAVMTKTLDMTEKLSFDQLIKKLDVTHKNYLLYGPPGTGKTHFVLYLSYLLNLNLLKREAIENPGFRGTLDEPLVRLLIISPSMLNDKYVGQTEKNIQKLYELARSPGKHKITIIFIDEIDALFSKRRHTETSSDHGNQAKTEFLNLIGGAQDLLKSCVFLIGATNIVDSIDPAFLRRFGTKYLFGLPDANERRGIIKSNYRGSVQKDHQKKLEEMVTDSDKLSHSALISLFKNLNSDNENTLDNSVLPYTESDVINAIRDSKIKGRNDAEGNTYLSEYLSGFLYVANMIDHDTAAAA